MKYLNLVIASLIGISASMRAQVIVNEFSAANYSNYGLGGGWNPEYEDWVEFYNPTGGAINIGGYYLSDDVTDPQKWQIPATANVPANGYLVILLSGRFDFDPGYLGMLNSNFKVTQTAGEDLVFSNTSGTILESYDFAVIGPNQANHSWGRSPNGGGAWAIHTNPSPAAANSGVIGESYSPRPLIDTQAGYYGGAINVNISSPEAGATIYYTTDGTSPTNASSLYTGPISLSATTPLRAICYSSNPNELPSFIETNTYFFGADQHSVYTVNISGAALGDGSWNGDELTDIEFFTPGGTFIAEGHGDSNEHGNDSNAYGQRGFDFIDRDAIGYDNAIAYPLFQHTDRDKFGRLIFKAAANDNYPFSGDGAHVRDAYVHELSVLGNMHLDERKTESCIVYINGNYWGVYEFREKVDDIDYTKFYYDQPDGFVDMLKTWGGTWNEFGDGADWYTLVNFITTNDMSIQANYDYVLSQYNTKSLIDYYILNTYTVSSDWLNWNTMWWRGRYPTGGAKKWRYVLWDNDATFGHYINYTGIDQTTPDADPCQTDDQGDIGGQGHIPVLNALFNNDQFMGDYVQRYAGLSNTVFSCDYMIQVLDSMINVMDPEMTRHCARWGGTYAGWQNNVQTMRDFILARCNNNIINGVADCYDVTPYNVTVMIDGVGEITIQEISVNDTNDPWSGTFFSDLPITLQALVDSAGGTCGAFAGWEITSGTGALADPTDPNTTLTITSDITLTAIFIVPSNGPITVMTDVQPAGSGIITVNGTDQTVYPTSSTFNPGDLLTLDIAANNWFSFNHWESLHSLIAPDSMSTTITLNPCVSDTILAIFDAIANFELMVNVSPSGAGTITMNATPLPSYPWSNVLEGNMDYYFITTPSDIWSSFNHWEINNHVLNPDEFNTNVWFTLTSADTLIAVYDVTPHFPITVIVDPPYSGEVDFANDFSTTTQMTVELAANEVHTFQANPDDFWDFKLWDADAANPLPDAQSLDVAFTFMNSDTVIAHFEKQPFAYYLPNSFTPNNDGVNDVFKPEGSAIDASDYHLMIFNRWGEKVFDTTDPKKGWDASHRDGEFYVKDEIYMYRLRIKSVHETDPKEISGSITVFR